jgi:hypothetical protein
MNAGASGETGDLSGQSRADALQIAKTATAIPSVQLSWSKGAGGEWYSLEQVNLVALGDYGVFVIWRNGDLAHASAVLYVGRGALRYEIARCRREALFATPGLKITWARVDDVRDIDGIAAYLYQRLHPMWGEVVPWSQALTVNLPAA